MPRIYDTTLYYNTGFNRGNVPGSPQVLTSFTSKTVPSVMKFQNRGLANIRVNITWEEVQDADYVSVGSSYYIITDCFMYNDNTAELSLLLDPLLTAGGISKLQLVSGWVQRAHPTTDGLFENILVEPWTPTSPMVATNPKVLDFEQGEEATAFNHLVGVTVDLDNSSHVAELYENSDGTAFVAVPQTKPPQWFTTITYEGRSYQLPNTIIYRFTKGTEQVPQEALTKALVDLRSLGLESAITCSYLIPQNAIANIQNAASYDPVNQHVIVKLEGKTETQDVQLPYEYGTVKNKKALAMYSTYTVTSVSSGDKLSFEARELYAGGTSPEFTLTADLSPNGTMYCRPTWYDKAETLPMQQAVVSASWLNEPLALYGKSGSAISTAQFARQMHQSELDYQNLKANQRYDTKKMDLSAADANLTAAIGIMGNLGTAVGAGFQGDWGGAVSNLAEGLAGTAGLINQAQMQEMDRARMLENQSYARASAIQSMGDNLFNYQTAQSIVPPDVLFPQTTTNQCFFGNGFVITHTHLSPADLSRFDRFLTMYGYASDRPMTASDFNSRTQFNYIKTANVQLKVDGVPTYVIQKLEDMLNNGIRIWHTAPNQAAYSDNPMR